MSRIRPNNGVGAPSILLIIVVLLLTTFGVLTLVSARADQTLSLRTIEATTAYYVADAAAQRRLMQIDTALSDGETPDDIVFLSALEDEHNTYTFDCETGDGRAIRVQIRCAEGDARCSVLSYRLVHLTGWGAQEENLFLASPAGVGG